MQRKFRRLAPQTHKPWRLGLASAPEERDEWTTPIRRAERAAGDLAYPDRFGAVPLELPDCSSAPIAAGRRCFIASNRGVLLRPGRARGVKFAVALLDSASPLVAGNRDADMVWANPLACGSDFLLCLARCQGKDLIAEAWRTAIDAS